MLEALKEAMFIMFGAHPYVILFVGMFFAGETVLLPALYFALRGDLHLSYVFALAIAATIASDFAWYFVGSHMKNRFAAKVIGPKLERNLARLDTAFVKRGGRALFLSKFVYGTRTAMQVLAGLHQMGLRKYFIINFLGILALLVFITALAYSIDATVEKLTDIAHALEMAFLAFIIVLVFAHLAFGFIWKKWFQQ